MKKLFLTSIMAGVVSFTASAHVDLYGIFVRINQQSFYCAMVSKNLCARVSKPFIDTPETAQRVICYNPDGSVAEDFYANSVTITETSGGTLVNYLP